MKFSVPALHYAHKIKERFLSRLICWRKSIYKEPGVWCVSPRGFSFKGTIILAFWDPDLVHLGDQLFHEPLARFIKNKYTLKVATDSRLEEFFRLSGFQTV